MQLNLQQKQAVEHTKGPLLLLAGAGSGKTLVLTKRLANILNSKLADPSEILAVTFTNRAAEEMKDRVLNQLSDEHSYLKGKSYSLIPFMGTFHSVCVKILRRDGHYIGIGSSFTIYDQQDKKQTIKNAMKELRINPKEINPNTIGSYMSFAKNELISPEDYKEVAQGNLQEALSLIYPKYENILRENNALDFDDLITKTIRLFRDYNEVAKKYSRRFKYILVDEYQDTNHAQYRLVKRLASKHKNICVVGDDDQSIYSWRGATIKNILSFEKDYPEAEVIKLEQNYRSTKTILDAAFEVVKQNQRRKEKKLWTENPTGEEIEVYTAQDEKDEAIYVAKEIEVLRRGGEQLKDMAVLYRTNAQSRVLEEAFLSFGLPYYIYGGTSFYSRKEIKDTLAYLRIIHNQKDFLSLSRIINIPSRKIGPKTLDKIKNESRENSLSEIEFLYNFHKLASDQLTSRSGVLSFANFLKKAVDASKELSVPELIQLVLESSGYLEDLDDGTPENDQRIENIKELLTVADKYKDIEPEQGLKDFLASISLIEEQQLESETNKDKNKVSLMTLHSVKGLEFPYVFIVGMEENLFPHSRSYADPEEMEEERRLAYVGITRAKNKLFLTHADSRKFYGSRQSNIISRFINDIPAGLLKKRAWDSDDDFSDSSSDYHRTSLTSQKKEKKSFETGTGDLVKHPIFGLGKIVEVDDSIVKISFVNHGTKTLSVDYANLKKA